MAGGKPDTPGNSFLLDEMRCWEKAGAFLKVINHFIVSCMPGQRT